MKNSIYEKYQESVTNFPDMLWRRFLDQKNVTTEQNGLGGPTTKRGTGNASLVSKNMPLFLFVHNRRNRPFNK